MKIFRRVLALGAALAICLSVCQMKASADTEWLQYDHGWCFGESDKTQPAGAPIGEHIAFTYEYGIKGKFSPMTQYRSDWSAWTLDGNAPSVGGWFVGASQEADGAIVWTAPKTMNVELSSIMQIALDSQYADLCDGAGIMVIQQNSYGFAPLWPKQNSFSWYNVKAEGSTELSGVKTKVRTGDRLLFIVHSLGNTADGDTVNLCPRIQQISGEADYPTGFYDWIDNSGSSQSSGNQTGAASLITYNHGWALANSDKSSAIGAPIDNAQVFQYLYGKNGDFQLLDQYRSDWQSWTYQGNAPAVAGWYVSANSGVDGAISFTAPRDMHAEISSTIEIAVDSYQAAACDGVGFMVLQQNETGFAPLWPQAGSFSWYDVKKQGSTDLSSLKTYLKKGERVLFVTHSIGESYGDTVNVCPEIKEISGGTQYPAGFGAWVRDNASASGEAYISSWYLGEGGYPYNTAENDYPFSYNYGFAGDYSNYLPLKETYDWGNVWRIDGQWAPWIAGYFISATRGVDGAVTFTAPETGTYQIENNLGSFLKLETGGGNESDGAQFIAVAQNQDGSYFPVYPKWGSWEWQKLEKEQEYPFDPVTISLNQGEKILFIAHCIGDDVNDAVSFDAKLTLKAKGDFSIRPAESDFVSWPEGFSEPDANQNPAKLSDLFSPASPTVGPLSLQFGYDGDYKLMTLYREDWGSWTNGGSSPAIGAWYMGAVAKNDAVLIYTAPANGQLNVKSENDLCLDWGELSDGAAVMVVLKNKNGERPIWPQDGKWEWERVNSGTEIPMENISVFVQKDDQVHVIVRSVGTDVYDAVDINPVFDLDDSVTSGDILEAVERVYPTEDDYIKNLLSLDGTLDQAAGAEKGQTSPPVWIVVLIAAGGVMIITAAVAVPLLIRRKKRRQILSQNKQS